MHKIWPHGIFPLRFLGMDAWMTLQLNVAFIHNSSKLLMCYANLLTFYPLVIAQPGTDRRSVDLCRNRMSVFYLNKTVIVGIVVGRWGGYPLSSHLAHFESITKKVPLIVSFSKSVLKMRPLKGIFVECPSDILKLTAGMFIKFSKRWFLLYLYCTVLYFNHR